MLSALSSGGGSRPGTPAAAAAGGAAGHAAAALPEGRLDRWRGAAVPLPAVVRLLTATYRDAAPFRQLWSGEPVPDAALAWLLQTQIERAVQWNDATVYAYTADGHADPVGVALLARRRRDALGRHERFPWMARLWTGYAAAPLKLGWWAYTRWTTFVDTCEAALEADTASFPAGYWLLDFIAVAPQFRGRGIGRHVLSEAVADAVATSGDLPIYALVVDDVDMHRCQRLDFDVVSQATAAPDGTVVRDDGKPPPEGSFTLWGMVRAPIDPAIVMQRKGSQFAL